MKILLFNYEFPPIGGGAGRASAEIARHLGLLGHEVFVVTAGFQDLHGEVEFSHGVRVLRLPCLREKVCTSNALEMLSYVKTGLKALPELVSRFRADIVLSFFGIPSGLVGAKAAKQLKCPHIISLRGMDVPGYDRRNLKVYHRFLGRLILRMWKNAQLLIANSRGLQAKALYYAREKHALTHLPEIAVIGNGIPAHTRVPSKPKALKLLCVGRFAKQKGHLNLLQVLSHPGLAHLPWQLDLVGEGPLRSQIEQVIQTSHLSERVHLTGWLSEEDLRLRYEESQIFLLPSEDEGMSNALLEAMSNGLLPIASAVGGNLDLIDNEHNGFLVRPGNPNDLRTILIRTIEMWQKKPQDFIRMANQALSSVQERTWPQMAKGYEEILARSLLLAGNASTVARDTGERGLRIATEIDHQRFLKRPAQKAS